MISLPVRDVIVRSWTESHVLVELTLLATG
jgi:hypothetical protein